MTTPQHRVLGRVLAVEETRAVAGAAKTTACQDNLTGPVVLDCSVPQRDSGTVIDATGPIADPAG